MEEIEGIACAAVAGGEREEADFAQPGIAALDDECDADEGGGEGETGEGIDGLAKGREPSGAEDVAVEGDPEEEENGGDGQQPAKDAGAPGAAGRVGLDFKDEAAGGHVGEADGERPIGQAAKKNERGDQRPDEKAARAGRGAVQEGEGDDGKDEVAGDDVAERPGDGKDGHIRKEAGQQKQLGEEGVERGLGGFRAGEAGIEAAGGDGHEQNNKIGEDDPAEAKGDEALVGEAATGDGLGDEKAAEQEKQVGADVAEASGKPL